MNSESSIASPLHVVVGVLVDDSNNVLVSRRHDHLHQGGLLEFPGGKLEEGEDRFTGLQREFTEELGILVETAFPLKKIIHHYQDKSVLLDVWKITAYSGQPRGLEGQPVYWSALADLDPAKFPAANAPIVDTLQLPKQLAITPDCKDWHSLSKLLDHYLNSGVELLQFRQKTLGADVYSEWYRLAQEASAGKLRIMFSGAMPSRDDLQILDGYHCDSYTLQELECRPVSATQLFGASCHSLSDLVKAESLNADYATLSPVLPTKSYPQDRLLGWSGFAEIRRAVSLPVFALGGVSQAELSSALAAGAQGVAGISAFLPSD